MESEPRKADNKRVIESISNTMSKLKEARDYAVINDKHAEQSRYSYRRAGLQTTIDNLTGIKYE